MAQIDRQQTVLNILRDLQDLSGLKKLFWEELNYERENQPLSMRGWPESARDALVDDPVLFASGGEDNAFHVLYCRLASAGLQRNLERPIVNQLIREHPYCLFVFSDKTQSAWHFLNVKYDEKTEKRRLFRRITVRANGGLRTATERLQMIDLASIGRYLFGISALEIQKRHDDAFDVESVTKAFYKELANWYFWALKHVHFPKDAPKEADGHDHIGVIRMITRLIFCWFVKEKGLIPEVLFDQRRLDKLLDGFTPDKDTKKDSVFYKAILQNLFFATLNTEMDKRGWAKDEQNFMAHSLYRFRELFREPDAALTLFKNIPFLNGGLFECLDKDLGENTKPRYVRIDGFSRRPDSQPVVPDFLFFGPEREEDLSADYGDKKFRKVPVRGLIHTLRRYHFTIEENTPIEQEVALDPELSGKVFENLLAAYNPETGATARKQTGSFYTPREIVDYMVDEALIAFLKGRLSTENAEGTEETLRRLVSWEESGHDFDLQETEALIAAIDGLKALDPAVGSGAFPMGILHKLVFILGKLDPCNEQWEQRQIQRVRDAIATAEKIEDAAIREGTVKELEQQIISIEASFRRNELDYGRKLYLIENCLYGVDIQSIAVQIAKMRFFISLIVDQRVEADATNLGVRPLPNLETKFVAANTLIGIEKPKQMPFRNLQIEDKEAELRKVREKHFNAKTPAGKARCREQDKKLRSEIAELLRSDGWGDTTAKQLAAWDPYDQNASAPFFDPEWMFGVRAGFDVVIGNPPYGIKFAKTDAARLTALYETFVLRGESYLLFVERGVSLMSHGGTLALITPDTFLNLGFTGALRKFLLQHTELKEMVVLPAHVFESATVDTALMFVTKAERTTTFHESRIRVKVFNKEEHLDSSMNPKKVFYARASEWAIDGSFNAKSDSNDLRILAKIDARYPTVSALGEIFSGVKAYEVGKGKPPQPERVRDEKPYTSTQKHDESWSPFFDGKHISRFQVLLDGNNWIRYGEWLAAPRDPDNFKGQKLLIRKVVGERLIATYIPHTCYCNTLLFVLKVRNGSQQDYKFLLGILNSSFIGWYCQRKFQICADDTFPQIMARDILRLPIPPADGSDQDRVVDLVTRILAAKAANPTADTSALEREIDRMVYELYGLTEEEIALVEGALPGNRNCRSTSVSQHPMGDEE
jgi:hypothetical protein